MRLWCIPFLISVTASVAQTGVPPERSVESVTVTAQKEREIEQQFVKAYTSPTAIAGKIARWEDGICPTTVGLSPKYAAYISQHIREIATEVHAPAAPVPCKPNIEVVFTTTPQKLADNIRKQHYFYLGYAHTMAQVDQLAVVSHSIQAWYTTATRDISGEWHPDTARGGRVSFATTGSRVADGLHSTLYHVIIVAEPAKLLNYEMQTVGDYLALMALTQLPLLDECRPLESIANLLARDCPAPPELLTSSDWGYLKGVYSMDADGNLNVQRAGIVSSMKKEGAMGASAKP